MQLGHSLLFMNSPCIQAGGAISMGNGAFGVLTNCDFINNTADVSALVENDLHLSKLTT